MPSLASRLDSSDPLTAIRWLAERPASTIYVQCEQESGRLATLLVRLAQTTPTTVRRARALDTVLRTRSTSEVRREYFADLANQLLGIFDFSEHTELVAQLVRQLGRAHEDIILRFTAAAFREIAVRKGLLPSA